ncbi:MAG: EAL domain-containing protein [Campylobacterales bacterium]|nr:EAL domain-containing protein [Campylobacterales bacterium]
MKKNNLSISNIYILFAVFIVCTVLLPIFWWTHSDFKSETENSINKYFNQTKNIIEVILENRVRFIENELGYLSKLDPRNFEEVIGQLEPENIDLLFYKYNNKNVVNLSTSFLYDTDRIIETIKSNKLLDKPFIQNLKVDGKYISILYNYKKIIDKKTGKVLGLIGAGEVLNDNLTFLNDIKNKTSIESISLLYKGYILSSTINHSTKEYEILKNEFVKKNLFQSANKIYYKGTLSCQNNCVDLSVVLSSDNSSFQELNRSFLTKSLGLISLFILLVFFGYVMTRRLLIAPVNKVIEDAGAKTYNENLSFLKEINAIGKKLYGTALSLNEYKKAVDVSSIVSKGDIDGNITYVNDKFCHETGYAREELIGKPHSLLRDPQVPSEIFTQMWQTIKIEKKPWSGYLSNLTKDGSSKHVKLTITPILDDNYNIVEFVALRENITELVNSKKALEESFVKDSLTGIYNRSKLTQDLGENRSLSLILINIDTFSHINDFYGNKIGDGILKLFASRVHGYFDSFAFNIYRVFGDEFAITVESGNVEEILFKVNIFLAQLEQSPFAVEGIKIGIRATSGISKPSRKNTFVNADLALKSAKRDKKDCEIFSVDNPISKELENNLLWTEKIKEALKEDRIIPFFQPIVNNHTKKIEKYESLVRMIEKDGKVISPFFFLEISKKSKLYSSITKKVIEKTFKYFQNNDYEFSVNLTIEDIYNEETVEFIRNSIHEYKMENRVVFEIVETVQIENFDAFSKFVDTFRLLGCKIAIDDFGTGYSNFEYLIKLNSDYIKIDGSLIKNIEQDETIYSVVETIVGFAKKSNLKVIAEFVETQEIQGLVEELGIEYSQGYLFSPPKSDIN